MKLKEILKVEKKDVPDGGYTCSQICNDISRNKTIDEIGNMEIRLNKNALNVAIEHAMQTTRGPWDNNRQRLSFYECVHHYLDSFTPNLLTLSTDKRE